MLAAVDVPPSRANQQPLAEGIEQEGILGFVTVAVGPERAALEDHLHVVAGIFQIGIEHGLARTPEASRDVGRSIGRFASTPGSAPRTKPIYPGSEGNSPCASTYHCQYGFRAIAAKRAITPRFCPDSR